MSLMQRNNERQETPTNAREADTKLKELKVALLNTYGDDVLLKENRRKEQKAEPSSLADKNNNSEIQTAPRSATTRLKLQELLSSISLSGIRLPDLQNSFAALRAPTAFVLRRFGASDSLLERVMRR